MEEEQAPPPPPPPEQGQDWGARFSAEIFGYNPYYYGKKQRTHSSSISNHRLGFYLSKLSFALDS
jgi:hypothetical protein